MGDAQSITQYSLTEDALTQMARRHIDPDLVKQVLAAPEQTELDREGREIYQSRFEKDEPPRTYLLRVFVDVDRTPPEVVTVYLTSKVKKYWRVDP
ncbi:MAG: DUF4258 domain-containing protein [Gloeomargaritaceae cyanobacterium C42_A2020_066]|nr:DUF4258 domain-containing protein [Gloeomargaritaceae cyanobacterium C42_A2020_066]